MEDTQFRADLELGLVREPFEIAEDAPIVQALATAVHDTLGEDAVFESDGGWMDSALLDAVGVPVVIFGPVGHGSHSVTEWVDLDSLERFTRVVAELAYRFCE
jgi:acetylornithine deacetylase